MADSIFVASLTTVAGQVPDTGEGDMLRFVRGFNWQRSEAHLVLLSRFASPRAPAEVMAPKHWKALLGEPPEQAIKRFLDEGMLSSPGNPVRGAAVGTAVFQCSSDGHRIVSQYLATAKAQRLAAEQEVLALLVRGQLREASKRMASYEAEQLIPRDSGVDWNQYSPVRDMLILTSIFGGTPKVLARLSQSKMEPLRLAVGMMHLWGADSPSAWLPTGFDTGSDIDSETAAHMLHYYAAQQAALVQYRQMGFVKAVRIEPRNDSDTCEACRRLASMTFRLDEVPDLPYEGCTSAHGCRCSTVTVADEP